jgi:hypothetical protein
LHAKSHIVPVSSIAPNYEIYDYCYLGYSIAAQRIKRSLCVVHAQKVRHPHVINAGFPVLYTEFLDFKSVCVFSIIPCIAYDVTQRCFQHLLQVPGRMMNIPFLILGWRNAPNNQVGRLLLCVFLHCSWCEYESWSDKCRSPILGSPPFAGLIWCTISRLACPHLQIGLVLYCLLLFFVPLHYQVWLLFLMRLSLSIMLFFFFCAWRNVMFYFSSSIKLQFLFFSHEVHRDRAFLVPHSPWYDRWAQVLVWEGWIYVHKEWMISIVCVGELVLTELQGSHK